MSYTGSLFNFLTNSSSAFHTILNAKTHLLKYNFKQLNLGEDWQLKEDERYFVSIYDSTLVGFIPHKNLREGMKIAISHSDFPCLKIKPNASILNNKYGKLNVEVYGGMILNTWLDRPLSIAGKVMLEGESYYQPITKFVDFKRPLMTIPNLAIHMDRTINTGKQWKKQKELLPLAFLQDKNDINTNDEEKLLDLLAKELSCEKTEILSYDLTIYQVETPYCLGFNGEFISAPRLDNITSVKACLEGIIADKRRQGLDIIVLFDNEEVGSRTKQGGASNILANIIERIYLALGYTRQAILTDLAKSMMLSLDVAHAMHPNYIEKNDLTNKPILNQGIAIKIAASQSYACDVEAVAIIKALCKKYKIKYQMYVNNSDIPGGSTIGSIASALLTMRTLDVGVPILAMHSARETMGKDDQKSLEALVRVFFEGFY